MSVSRPTTVTGPTQEPVTLTQAKKQLEIPSDLSDHDEQLIEVIQQAREQWEHDTDTALLTQTLSVTASHFWDGMELPRRPIQSISSITYFDGDNSQQTLASSIYQLDAPNRRIRLAYLQNWPTTAIRWDAITITYVAGYAARSSIPGMAKRAILLQLARWFEDRDMLVTSSMSEQQAYDRLVHRMIRSNYP